MGKKQADRRPHRSVSRFPIHSVGLLLALGLHDDRQGPDLDDARALQVCTCVVVLFPCFIQQT